MEKIWLIFQREYLTRVRKKSFVVMTLVGPLLLAALFVVPVLLASSDDDVTTVRVLDGSNLLAPGLLAEADPAPFKFVRAAGPLAAEKARIEGQKGTVLLVVPAGLDPSHPAGVQLVTASSLGLGQQNRLERLLRRQLENQRLTRAGVNPAIIDAARAPADFELTTTRLDKSGEQAGDGDLAAGMGYTGAFLIYIFIFLYGIQVMRGVIEEKTSRIVEVMISSVKPFELMMGKVLGIAAVGLTQFALWVVLSTTLSSVVASQFGIKAQSPAARAMAAGQLNQTTPDADATATTAAKAPVSDRDEKKQATGEFLGLLQNQNWPLLLAIFVFYFLGGYLLYAALFGAVGSAVDSDTDAQQFMLPITMPLVLTFIVAQTSIIRNPDGAVATWMSLIPFTSPIAMVMRLPFGGVPGWQLALSMGLLVAGFVGTIWLAARIYRVGILMYGKKPTFKELGKWLFYKG